MLRRTLVLIEISAVFLVGTLAARGLLFALGAAGSRQVIQGVAAGGFDASAAAVALLIRWSVVIALALLVGWLVARHAPRDYGMTLAGRSYYWHLRAGIVTLAFGFLPIVALLLIRHYFQLAGGPPSWAVIDQAPRTLDFWLFMLASSIIIPPLVEEVFFRGYAQTRLATVFRPVTAILIVAVLFMAAHVQYMDGSLLGTLMLPLGIWQFTVLGLSRMRTGSLVAPMIAHAIGNIPMRAPEQWLLTLALTVIVLWALIRSRGALLPRESRIGECAPSES